MTLIECMAAIRRASDAIDPLGSVVAYQVDQACCRLVDELWKVRPGWLRLAIACAYGDVGDAEGGVKSKGRVLVFAPLDRSAGDDAPVVASVHMDLCLTVDRRHSRAVVLQAARRCARDSLGADAVIGAQGAFRTKLRSPSILVSRRLRLSYLLGRCSQGGSHEG